MFAALMQSSRRARKLLAAVAAGSGVAAFATSGIAGWSGLGLHMDLRHRARIAEQAGGVTATFDVATVALAPILEHYGLHHVDYLSLDVEGAELAVLHGIDFGRCDIDVLDIENNYGEPAVEEFMLTFGYRKFHTIEINDFYRRA